MNQSKIQSENRAKHGQGGFTLIELMVVMSLLVVISGVLFSLVSGMAKLANANDTRILGRDEMRLAQQRIGQLLRMATPGVENLVVTGTPFSASTN